MKFSLMDALKTGHKEIDHEHDHIIQTINALTTAAGDDTDGAGVHMLLEQFLAACEEHFRNEETILATAGYPSLDEHSAYHSQMLIKARAAQQRCIAAEERGVFLVHLNEIVSILIDDIVRSDMGFVSYLQTQGLAEPRH